MCDLSLFGSTAILASTKAKTPLHANSTLQPKSRANFGGIEEKEGEEREDSSHVQIDRHVTCSNLGKLLTFQGTGGAISLSGHILTQEGSVSNRGSIHGHIARHPGPPSPPLIYHVLYTSQD